MRRKVTIVSFILMITFSFLMAKAASTDRLSSSEGSVGVSGTEGEDLIITVKAGEYQITSGDKGERIEMEGFGYLMVPGKPLLPAKNFLIALPPGAKVQSVEVKGIGGVQLPETYQIMPTPPGSGKGIIKQFTPRIKPIRKKEANL